MSTQRNLRSSALTGALSLVGALALTALSAAPAGAAVSAGADAFSSTGESLSCWVNVDTGESSCFDSSIDTFEKIAQDTGLPVVAVPTDDMARGAATPEPRATAASYILAVGYEGLSYSGANIGYYTTNSAICTGPTYSYASLGSWNDRFQSFDSYNGCTSTLYQDINFAGPAYGPIGSSSNLGNMRSKASSIRIS